MVFLKRSTYAQEKNIFLYHETNEANRNAVIANAKIQLNTAGKRQVPEGMFVAQIGDEARYLPRATVTTATGTGSTAVVATPVQVFAPGDVLFAVEPYATVTLGGTPGATTETVTVTIDGVALTTVIGSVVLADAAVAVANAINGDTILSQKVFAKVAGAVVYVFSKDGISTYSFAVAKAGDITVTASGALTAFAAALGTVSTVNVATNTITLTGDASAILPVGSHIGVRTVTEVLGVDAHQRDYTDAEVQTIGVYNISSGVRENYLPYIDGDIKRRLPQLNFLTKA
jgi:hypothetical protein